MCVKKLFKWQYFGEKATLKNKAKVLHSDATEHAYLVPQIQSTIYFLPFKKSEGSSNVKVSLWKKWLFFGIV